MPNETKLPIPVTADTHNRNTFIAVTPESSPNNTHPNPETPRSMIARYNNFFSFSSILQI